MATCQWCGDKHGADQLCQRAQRGMTRRSFCFLFGAGVAGAAAASGLDLSPPRRLLGLPADAVDLRVVQSMRDPATASFQTNQPPQEGSRIVITFDGAPIFEGRVLKPRVVWQNARPSFLVTCKEHAEAISAKQQMWAESHGLSVPNFLNL